MRCFIGIDLGSTTTKAVVIDENQNILGRGITNSRSNYDTAATIAKQEALLKTMVVDLERFGRKNGKGFYDYDEKRVGTPSADAIASRIGCE